MKAQGITDYASLIVWHLAKTRDMLTKTNANKKAIYWSNEDTYYMSYKDDDILMWWGHTENIATFKDVYPKQKVVFAPADVYYIDCGMGNKYGAGTFCDPFKTWWTIYNFEPSNYINDGSVLGGELPVWGELSSEFNIHTKLWPRAVSLADKYWGQNVAVDLVSITQRLTAFSEYLNDQGIPSAPITSTWCEMSEHCFSHYGTNQYLNE